MEETIQDEREDKVLVSRLEWQAMKDQIRRLQTLEREKKAEDLLLTVGFAVAGAVLMVAAPNIGGALTDALHAHGAWELLKAWMVLILVVVFISYVSIVLPLAPLAALRRIIVEEFSCFKARRLDAWLEQPAPKHGTAHILLAFVGWTLFVAFLFWVKWG